MSYATEDKKSYSVLNDDLYDRQAFRDLLEHVPDPRLARMLGFKPKEAEPHFVNAQLTELRAELDRIRKARRKGEATCYEVFLAATAIVEFCYAKRKWFKKDGPLDIQPKWDDPDFRIISEAVYPVYQLSSFEVEMKSKLIADGFTPEIAFDRSTGATCRFVLNNIEDIPAYFGSEAQGCGGKLQRMSLARRKEKVAKFDQLFEYEKEEDEFFSASIWYDPIWITGGLSWQIR